MTGTSVDGIDVALANIDENKNKTSIELIAYETFGFTKEIKSLIEKIITAEIRISDVSLLNSALAGIYAETVEKLCTNHSIDLHSIQAVGMHGQTVWHDPKGKNILGVPSTLQLGSIPILSQKLKLNVVGDFRTADIALGGEGAPLVPIFDYAMFKSSVQDTICLNIGGISNITIIPAGAAKTDIIAFDAGPGNTLIDAAMKKFYNKNCDYNGEICKTGKTDCNFLMYLIDNAYFMQEPPKSSGREYFNESIFTDYFEKYNISKENIITTLTEFTAWAISDAINRFAMPLFSKKKQRLICSGGGTENPEIMKFLKTLLPYFDIIKSDELGIPSDCKEALCFAYLAYLNLKSKPGNLPSVTGASHETVLGIRCDYF